LASTPAELRRTHHGATQQALYREAKAAGKRGAVNRAHELMLEAWRLRRAPDVAMNLGRIEMALERWRDAAEHLAFGFRHYPADSDPVLYAQNVERLLRCKREIVTIELTVVPETARITVNGRAVSSAFELPPELYAEPGTIEMTAELEGYETLRKTIEGSKGETVRARLELKPARAPSHAGAGTAPPPPIDPGAASIRPPFKWWPAVIGGGASAVALGVGIAFKLDASAARDDADELAAGLAGQLGDNPCRGGAQEPAACTDLRAARDRELGSNAGANAAFITSGILLAAAAAAQGAVLWTEAWAKPQRAELAASVQRGTTMLLLRGSF
jgi:hypothetical protein